MLILQVVGPKLDEALAELAKRLGTSVDQLGPEIVKFYGGQLHAQTMATGWLLIILLLGGIGLFVTALLTDREGPMVGAVICATATIIAAFVYVSAIIDLGGYMASPLGYTTAHLLSK